MNTSPAVSILITVYNTEKYIEQCLDSVLNQTLQNIEIIIIDDGSSDKSGKIIDLFCQQDKRIKVIHQENAGYGASLNTGIKNASGEYIGMVDSDDYAETDMFEKLYQIAKANDADVVKSNYYAYKTSPAIWNHYFENLSTVGLYDTVFSPCEHLNLFKVAPSLWSSIYRRSMLMEQGIYLNETPGACFQDTSFALKVWLNARRVVLTKDAFIHYRTDNPNSSVKAPDKVYCICFEYETMNDYLDKYPEKKSAFEEIKNYVLFNTYTWNYRRIALEYKYAFLGKMNSDFKEAEKGKGFNRLLFNDREWDELRMIIDDPDTYYLSSIPPYLDGFGSVVDLLKAYRECHCQINELNVTISELRKEKKAAEKALSIIQRTLKQIKLSYSYKIGRYVTHYPRKIKRIMKNDWKRLTP